MRYLSFRVLSSFALLYHLSCASSQEDQVDNVHPDPSDPSVPFLQPEDWLNNNNDFPGPTRAYATLGASASENPVPQGLPLWSIAGFAESTPLQEHLVLGGEGGSLLEKNVNSPWHIEVRNSPEVNITKVAINPITQEALAVSSPGFVYKWYADQNVWFVNFLGSNKKSVPEHISFQNISPISNSKRFWAVGHYMIPSPGKGLYNNVGAIFQCYSTPREWGILHLDLEVLGSDLSSNLSTIQDIHDRDGLVYAAGNQGILLRRSSSGSWALDPQTITSKDILAVWIQNSQTDEVFAVTETEILRKQGGVWSQVTNLPNKVNQKDINTLHWQAVKGQGTHVWVTGTAGAVLHFDGNTWESWDTQASQNINALWAYEYQGNPQLYIVGQEGLILKRVGNTWQSEFSSVRADSRLQAIWGATKDIVYAVGSQATILERTQAGASFKWKEALFFPNEKPDADVTFTAMDGFPAGTGAHEVYTVGTKGSIFHRISSDSGFKWKQEAAGLTSTGDWSSVWVGKDQVYIVGNQGRVARKIGDSWSFVLDELTSAVPAVKTTNLLTVHGTTLGNVYIGGEGGLIVRYDFASKTWKQEASGITSDGILSIVGKADHDLYAVTKNVLLHRGAKGWETISGPTDKADLGDVTPQFTKLTPLFDPHSDQVVAVAVMDNELGRIWGYELSSTGEAPRWLLVHSPTLQTTDITPAGTEFYSIGLNGITHFSKPDNTRVYILGNHKF